MAFFKTNGSHGILMDKGFKAFSLELLAISSK
jgi:hypothetical protein